MDIHFSSGDFLPLLFVVIVLLTISFPLLRRNSIPVPELYVFEEVRDEVLSDAQRKLFAQWDADLQKLDYLPLGNYRVANYGSNLMRCYSNRADPAACMLMIVEVKSKVGPLPAHAHTATLLFNTRFADGRMLTTRNMQLPSVFEQPPENLVQECPGIDDPADLKRRHDARAAGLGTPVAPANDLQKFFDQAQKEHRRFSEYQLERGNYERHGEFLRLTNKVFLRGIRNFLFPFAHRLSAGRMFLVLILGIGIPFAAFHWVGPWLFMHSIQSGRLPRVESTRLIGAVAAVLAGGSLGLLVGSNAFIWTYLLIYLGVQLGTNWQYPASGFCCLGCIAAYGAHQLQQRRRLVLSSRSQA